MVSLFSLQSVLIPVCYLPVCYLTEGVPVCEGEPVCEGKPVFHLVEGELVDDARDPETLDMTKDWNLSRYPLLAKLDDRRP